MLVYYISGLIYCRSSGGFLNHLDFIAMFRSSQKTHKNVRPMSIQIFFIFHAFCIAMVTLNIWEIIKKKNLWCLLLENYRNMCMGLCYTLVMHCTVRYNNATNQQLIRCMCSKENSALGFHITDNRMLYQERVMLDNQCIHHLQHYCTMMPIWPLC